MIIVAEIMNAHKVVNVMVLIEVGCNLFFVKNDYDIYSIVRLKALL